LGNVIGNASLPQRQKRRRPRAAYSFSLCPTNKTKDLPIKRTKVTSKYSKEQHLKMNQAAWDEAHRFMAAKRRKNPNWGDEFRDGGGLFTDMEIELLGDVSGLDMLQLSCAGDANQAFSLANLGAKVTACDFSPVAIEDAKENAVKIGLDVSFVVDDSQRLSSFKEGQFDLVHADYNLYFYEDLPIACHNWYRVLRTGGRLFVHEWNSVTRCLKEDKTSGSLKVTRSYDDRTPEYSPFRVWDFVSELEAVEFHYTMADILNAIIQAGFAIEKMSERTRENFIMETRKVENVKENAEGTAKARLPHDYFLVARKPE